MWGQRVDWRVQSEGGGSCLFRTTLTDLRPRASHKIQRLPHPASLKNTILFKVYRRRPTPRPSAPGPIPASPRLLLLFFLVAKTQWCAKISRKFSSAVLDLRLIMAFGNIWGFAICVQTPCTHFSSQSKASDRFFFPSKLCVWLLKLVSRRRWWFYSSKENEADPQRATARPPALLMWHLRGKKVERARRKPRSQYITFKFEQHLKEKSVPIFTER